ncbi:c-type cytochrome [Aquamicrobium sp.]|uniref:c-type cytochrome n=1 Tax=Aquamicrobium sp. TaxID=1872579 RepID=UPI002583B4ED|nr:c-type cytochrome [Aquamicrobium sp.]MCK9549289.1 c-type cytochrome [Aquamicrobium sp.]
MDSVKNIFSLLAAVALLAGCAQEKNKDANQSMKINVTHKKPYKDAATEAKEIYQACASCHAIDGKTQALGKSALLAGQTAQGIEQKIRGYKSGSIDLTGNGPLMKVQVEELTDSQIVAISKYIETLK